MNSSDNRLMRWVLYNLAWWIVKRHYRRRRARYIAAGVIGLVVAGGLLASRAGSE